MSLGFKDPIYLKYETLPDRAVLSLTFLIGSLLMYNLLSLRYKVYCMFSFLLKVLQLTDAFQHVASRVQNLVILPSSCDDGMFIGFLGLISGVCLRLAHVRASFISSMRSC